MKILNVAGRFLWPVFLLVFSLAAGAAERTVYLVNDALGSPVAAMDEQGGVIWRESYAPYGERRTKEPGNPATPAYTGKPEDPGTGLVYMGARMYDPVASRFTGIDPVGYSEGNAQSFGRYTYANNSPYVFVDPNGEVAFLIPLAYMAYRAYSAADTIESTITNVQVIADPTASTMDRALAGGEMASSLLGGKAGRGAFSMAEKKVANAGDKIVYRLGDDKESASRLARKAGEAEQAGFPHGVSVSTTKPPAGTACSSASCTDLEARGMKVHPTPTKSDPNHHTVELPKPVTPESARSFNDAFGRR